MFLESGEYEDGGRSMISAMRFLRAYEAFMKQPQLQLAAKSAILVAHCLEERRLEYVTATSSEVPLQPAAYYALAIDHYAALPEKKNDEFENQIYALEKLKRYVEIFAVLR